ncbi:receptor expression-enhancing protein 6-like [Haemaphysalis longicornis]
MCAGFYSCCGPISRRGRAHARARAACQGSRGGRSSLAHRGPPKQQPTSARPAMAQEINEELGRVLRERGVVGDTFDNIERKAKIKREQVVYGGVAVTCMLFMLNILGAKTSVLITTVWPMLGSIRAIDRADVLAMQKWTAYWIVYALVNVIFRFVFAGIYLHFRRIYFLRLLFLAWCAAPIQANGANVIFQKAFAGKIFKEGGRGVPGGIPPMGAAPAAGGREMSDNGRKMKR